MTGGARQGDERDDDQDTEGPGARQDDEQHDDQDAIDPRQDIQHAKNITTKTITTKNITAKTITAKDITAKDNNGEIGTEGPREGARYLGTGSQKEDGR